MWRAKHVDEMIDTDPVVRKMMSRVLISLRNAATSSAEESEFRSKEVLVAVVLVFIMARCCDPQLLRC